MSQLERATRAYRKAELELDRARAQLHAAIAGALQDGTSQADVMRTVGMARESVRRIARGAGIGPAAVGSQVHESEFF